MNIHHLKPAYVNVAYCIDTPTYHKPEANEIGFMSEEDRTAFFADCKRVFQNGGWEIEHDYAVNGKSRLYLHPQQFSGIVHTELLHVVPELIAGAALFQLQPNGVRVMESVYDITEEQQREYLATRRPEIEAELLAVFRTSQRKYSAIPALCSGGTSNCRQDGSMGCRRSTNKSTTQQDAMSMKYSGL